MVQPKHARPDEGQATIANAFRGCGALVVDLHLVGGGVPDLLIGIDGLNVLVEVKKPRGPRGGERSSSGQKLNEKQASFHHDWRGGPIFVVRSEAEVVSLVKALRDVDADQVLDHTTPFEAKHWRHISPARCESFCQCPRTHVFQQGLGIGAGVVEAVAKLATVEGEGV